MENYVIVKKADGTTIYVRDVQQKLLTIMKELDAFFSKYKIEYWLCGGSALGAIRHNGFIPWDDDMDIIMTRENYNKLIAISNKLPSHLILQAFETNVKANVCVPAKVFLKGSKVKEYNTLLKNRCEHGDALFIDIFIADEITPSKYLNYKYRIQALILMVIIVVLENMHINPIMLKKMFKQNAIAFAKKSIGSNQIGFSLEWCFNSIKKPVVYSKSSVFPIQKVAFEDTILPIPKDPKEMLDIEVSPSHMQYPPEKDRKPKHFKDVWL